LLDQLGLEYEKLDIDIVEQWDGHETAQTYVKRLALEKGRVGAKRAKRSLPVLAADTEVVIDDRVLGKPVDRADALAMLQCLSGRTHVVYTAVALVGKQENILLNTNRVSFRTLSEQECEDYCDTGEPFGKAGAYAIQGRAAAFITRLEGSYSGVMGLPLYETRELLIS